ncbi:unnamed protein product [Orchesella dallaii]|uniref:Uncharacterized protein n=1 Tax=Orchesella dallaii TaxID=48710 RepID=A0ABP1QTZ5_9HEXA
MLSQRLLRLTAWRLYLMELTLVSPIGWDWKTHTMKPSKTFVYWNWLLQQFYLFWFMMVLIIKLFIKFRSKPENDIPDDAGSIDTKKDDAFNALLTAVDITFIAGIAIILGLAINLIRARQDLICLFNKMVEVDTILTGTCMNVIATKFCRKLLFKTFLLRVFLFEGVILSSEKYQVELQGNPTVKAYSLRVELILGGTYVTTLIVVPAAFIMFFLQEAEPIHRLYAEVLEIHVEFKLEHIHFFLVAVFFVYLAFNNVCLYALCATGKIQVASFWLVNTTPLKDSPIEYIKEEEGKVSNPNPVLRTRLGLLDGKVIMDIYKRLQFLDRLVDNLITSLLVTLHHGGCMIVFVSTCYMCIEYVEEIILRHDLKPIVLVPFGIVVVEWVETIEVCRIHDTSRASVKILKNRFRTSFTSTRKRKSKELWKMAEALPILWIEAAYPFYRYNRGIFLQFFHKAIDLLVSALMTGYAAILVALSMITCSLLTKTECAHLKLSLFYESLCKESGRFVHSQVYPTLQKFGGVDNQYFEVDFFPYGKAVTEFINGSIVFNCQHGERECVGNKLQACAVAKFSRAEAAAFINCTMKLFNPPYGDRECATSILGLNYTNIENCYYSWQSDVLHAYNGIKTKDLRPSLYFVPWPVFNGVFLLEELDVAQKDLFTLVCDKLAKLDVDAPQCKKY